MTHDKTGGPAFPAQPKYEHPGGGYIVHDQGGMTLRDYFAGQALAVAWDAKDKGYFDGGNDEMAEAAWQIADAMLREREDHTNED